MLIDWPEAFDQYMDRLEARADVDAEARKELDLLLAELSVLEELEVEPAEDSASLKRVRQSGKYPVWRVAHPFVPRLAVRLIAWFPPDEPGRVVVALFAGNKAQMGDVFYDSVGVRADAAVEAWLRQQQMDGREGP